MFETAEKSLDKPFKEYKEYKEYKDHKDYSKMKPQDSLGNITRQELPAFTKFNKEIHSVSKDVVFILNKLAKDNYVKLKAELTEIAKKRYIFH